MNNYQSFIKLLPMQKDGEPVLIKYTIMYNATEANANHDRVQSINQKRVRDLIMDKLLARFS